MRTEDLTVNQNTDVSIKINVTSANGAAMDINDKLFSGSMKKRYADASNTAISFGTSITNANNGVITLSLTSAQTTALDADTRYVYDVMMYDSGNTNIEKILDGKVFVRSSVTSVGG